MTQEATTQTEEVEELPLLKSPRVKDVQLVETAEQLNFAIDALKNCEGPFGLDAERASGFKYSQRAYLIQVHRKNSPIFLIDPISVVEDGGPHVFERFAVLLGEDEWILHAASQDIPCLRELGIRPRTLFDTELGSRIAGLPRVGLGAVTEHFLKLRLAKEHSAVDWSIRPLHDDWLNYAALDVDVLIELREGVSKLLAEQGKTEWAAAEFANVALMQPKEPKVDRWRGLTGMHEIKDQRSLAIARELWLARENLAEKLDVSPGRLIPDSSIVGLAANPVKTRPELAASKTFSGRASRSYLDTWWEALSLGLNTRDLPPTRLPQVGIPNHRTWPNRFPDADQRLKNLRPIMSEISESVQVPLENILTPDYLRQLCFEPPQVISEESVAEMLTSLGARKWQVELVSGPLAAGLLNPAKPAATTQVTDGSA
jgi:ribonuclease D